MAQRSKNKGSSSMRKMRNNQGIIILLALGLVVGMTAMFVGRAPIIPSGTAPTSSGETDSLTGLINQGNAAYDNQNFADAISYYERALEQNPNMIGVLVDLGTAYWSLTPPQPTKAVELYDRAIDLEPTFVNAHFNKGIVLFYGLNKPDEAITVWNKVLELNPPQNYIDSINDNLIPAAEEMLSSQSSK